MEDKTIKVLNQHPNSKQDSLIPILQEVQDSEGYISEKSVIKIGEHLNISSSKIYGVATFYNQFRFQPLGKFHIQICRGTACHVLGSASVLSTLEKHLKLKSGETSRDGLFSIEIVACIGACGLAPVICVNGKFHARVTEKSIIEIIENYRKENDESKN